MKNYVTNVGFAEPTAFITKKKQRLKQHNNNTVYLDNGEEFQIELFNPTDDKVLAKIELNGKPISSSGIVLKPGQRVFLERFIDTNNKFLFDTYEVNGNNEDAKRAIENNGQVLVSFYKKYNPIWVTSYGTTTTIINTPWYLQNLSPTYTTYSSGGTFTVNTASTTCNTSYFSSDATYSNSLTAASSAPHIKSASLKTKSLETGRVEKGESSNQSFTYDHDSYQMFASWFSKWQILPISRKVIDAEDLKVFCTGCGAKRKKDTHRFCPHCGTKY